MTDQPGLFDDGHRCPTCGRATGDMEAPGRVGRRHPHTSRDAARLRFGTQRYRVLEALAQLGPSTAADIAPVIGRSRNQTATRLGELRESGLVTYHRGDDDEIVEARTGPSATGLVQRITPLGRQLLADANERKT